jgi:hypothetical protein
LWLCSKELSIGQPVEDQQALDYLGGNVPTAPAPKKLPGWQQAIIDNIIEGIGDKIRASLGPDGIKKVDDVLDKVEDTVAKWPPNIPEAVKTIMLKAEQVGAAITKIGRDGVPPLPLGVVQLVDATRLLTAKLKLRIANQPAAVAAPKRV